jgi:hypothetical protein
MAAGVKLARLAEPTGIGLTKNISGRGGVAVVPSRVFPVPEDNE